MLKDIEKMAKVAKDVFNGTEDSFAAIKSQLTPKEVAILDSKTAQLKNAIRTGNTEELSNIMKGCQ